MIGRRFRCHRRAALTLLRRHWDNLTRYEAEFLGHCCILAELTPKQRRWLCWLLNRYDGSSLARSLV